MARSRIVNLANFDQFTAINVLSDPGVIGGPVVIPNCIQVVLNWTQDDGKAAHNVLYARSAGVPNPTVADAEAIRAGLVAGTPWSNLARDLATTTALASVSVMSVHTAGQPIFLSTGPSTPGTDATGALPNEVAIVATLRTALRGAQNRGRMFVPGFAKDTVAAGNVIGPAVVTDVATWANNIISVISGRSWTWVIGQKARAQYTGSTGTVHPARPAGSVPITSAVVRDNHFDSMRRRGLK